MLAFPASCLVVVRTIVVAVLLFSRTTSVNVLAGVSRQMAPDVDSGWFPAAPAAGHVDDQLESDSEPTDTLLSVDRSPDVPELKADALDELSRVFGINHVPASEPPSRPNHPLPRRRRAPPEYMIELYNAVAYSDGISKTANPYEADVVRGILDKAATDQVYYYFNVSHINRTEDVLEAELHLYKLRPAPDVQHRQRSRSHTSHVVEVRLYEVLSEGVRKLLTADQPEIPSDQLRLVVPRRVSTHRHGWEVFKIGDIVRRWVNDSTANHGLLVTATTNGGESVDGTAVRFAQRSEHHDSKQPVLVIFSDERQLAAGASGFMEDDDSIQPPLVNDSNLKNMRRNYVNFLNERHRAQHGPGPLANSARTRTRTRRPNAYYMNPVVHQRLVNETSMSSSRSRRSSDAASGSHHGGSRTGYNHQAPSRRRKRTCQRHEMYVDFEKIGWSGWIISPKGYNAYQCRGICPFPLGQNQHPSNHATVQSIVHALRIGPGTAAGSQQGGVNGADGAGVDTPCCVPNKLYSISLLYFDDDENVILKQYDEMVAASCGCH